MDLIAMAAMLIQQSTGVETMVRFDTHRIEQGVNQSFSCVNYLSSGDRFGPGQIRSDGTFLCDRQDGRSWNVQLSDIITGLDDDGYRVCVATGGMQYSREQTGRICIGDL